MPLTLVKRGNIFWMRGTVRGIPVYKSTKTDNEDAAEMVRITTEWGTLQESIFGAKATRSFSDAADSYLRAGGDGRFLGTPTTGLRSHFAARRLKDIHQDDVDKAARKLYPTVATQKKVRLV